MIPVHDHRLLVLTTAAAVVASLAVVVPTTAQAAPDAWSAATAGPVAVWTAVSERPAARRGGLKQRVAPSSYAGYHLDLDVLSGRLDRAPMEGAPPGPRLR